MDIRSTTFEQLTGDEIAAWATIQRNERHLASPFFRPEFTEAVSAVRNNVEVAIFEESGRPVGFLPFQRSRWNTGVPVGGDLSDFHGLIAPSGFTCDPIALLHACRLTTWCFGSLLSEQACFSPFVWHETDSPYIDVSNGFSAYIAQKENGGSIRSKCGQKLRKLAREVGPVRCEPHVTDRKILSTLIEWKGDQYCRTKVPNILDYSWASHLLYKLLDYQTDEFSTSVSVLYAGKTIAGMSIGIRYGAVLQPVLPTYNVELARYSPGLIHWLETIKSAESHGIRRIDLGKGREPYKWRLMNGVTRVAEGVVDSKPATAMIGRAWCHVRERVRESSLAARLRLPVRMTRLARHWTGRMVSDLRMFYQSFFLMLITSRNALLELLPDIDLLIAIYV